jgi:hypothetical protein
MGKKVTLGLVGALFVVACATGCSSSLVYEADRQIQEQNSEAATAELAAIPSVQKAVADAAAIVQNSSDQAAAQVAQELKDANTALASLSLVAQDIKANSDQELKNWGNPKTSQPYTPANSNGSRGTSDQQHSNPWYAQLWSYILTGAGTALSIYGLANGIPGLGALFNKPAVQAVGAALQTAVNIKTKADQDPTDTIHLADVESEIMALAKNPVMGPYVDGLLKSLHLSSTLPQTPAASTPPAQEAPAPAPTPAAAPAPVPATASV